MIIAKSNARLEDEKKKRDEFYLKDPPQDNSPVIAHIRGLFADAKAHFDDKIKVRLEDNLRAKLGEYDDNMIARLTERGIPSKYIKLAANKMRTAAAWLRDAFNPVGERPWSFEMTPVPTLHPEAAMEIDNRLLEIRQQYLSQGIPFTDSMEQEFKRMLELVSEATISEYIEHIEKQTDDELVEGGFYQALNEFIDDITVFPVAYLKGPVARHQRRLRWVESQGDYVPETYDEIVREYERVSPFDIYPGPYNTTCHDGYIFQVHRFTKAQLSELLGLTQYGYDDAAIQEVLDNGCSSSGLSDSSTREGLEGKTRQSSIHLITVLEFYGKLSGKQIKEFRLNVDTDLDDHTYYNVCAWLAGDSLIKLSLNDDPLGRTPFDKASFCSVPGSFLGQSIYEMMDDLQDLINSAVRNLDMNMAYTAGPITTFDKSKLSITNDTSVLAPFSVFEVEANVQAYSQNQRPIEFYQAQSHVTELSNMISMISGMADMVTNIPQYMGGTPTSSGAASTATGFSMLMRSATNSMKLAIQNINEGVLVPRLKAMYTHKMLYDPASPSKRGDLNIRARGTDGMGTKEAMHSRLVDFLNNPNIGLLGPEVVKAMLKDVAKTLGLNIDKYLSEAAATAPAQPQQAPVGANPTKPDGRVLGDGSPVSTVVN